VTRWNFAPSLPSVCKHSCCKGVDVDTAYLPAPGTDTAAAMPVRMPAHLPRLNLHDCAVRAMTDYRREPPLTITAEQSVEQALDAMFRAGARACLVVCDRAVIGVLTAEDAHGALQRPLSVRMPQAADVMTSTAEVPAMDWQTLQECRVRDLLEIFDGAGVQHLVVLENDTVNASSVRGVIHRSRLERQLRVGGSAL
jgi:predicted transcriptional regulator